MEHKGKWKEKEKKKNIRDSMAPAPLAQAGRRACGAALIHKHHRTWRMPNQSTGPAPIQLASSACHPTDQMPACPGNLQVLVPEILLESAFCSPASTTQDSHVPWEQGGLATWLDATKSKKAKKIHLEM